MLELKALYRAERRFYADFCGTVCFTIKTIFLLQVFTAELNRLFICKCFCLVIENKVFQASSTNNIESIIL